MLLVAKPVGRTGLWSVTDQSTGQRHGQYTAEAAVLRFGRGAITWICTHAEEFPFEAEGQPR
jgi:hypothetical protein